MYQSRLRLAAAVVASLLTFAACGDDETSSTTASGGAGGSTTGPGGGGGSQPVLGARPTCPTGAPTGGTPEARADSAAALNAAGTKMLVVGGDVATVVCGASPVREHVDEAWVLDTACGEWTQVAVGPPARARHIAVSDFVRDRAVVFGGRTRSGNSGPYTLFNDVWTFDFATEAWSEITTTGTAPSPRANTAGAVVGDELFVYGGNTSTNGLNFTPEGDLFALNLVTNTWREITSPGPTARLFHGMAADPVSGTIIVGFGGDANAFVGPFFTDLWAYNPQSEVWTELDAPLPAGATEGRIKLAMAIQPATDGQTSKLFVVAGHDDGSLGNRNDILATELPAGDPASWPALTWTKSVAGDTFNNPATGQCDFPADFTNVDMVAFERRSAVGFAPSSDGHSFVTFGGDSDCGRLNDAWWFNATDGSLENIRPTMLGLTCPRSGVVNCNGLCG